MLEPLAVVLAIALSVVIWQYLRYQRIRTTLAQDLQHLLHPATVFHVILMFKLKNGDKLIETARQYSQWLTANSTARLIYAGQAAFTVHSQQLGNRDWDGVLLFEFPSRADYEASRTATASGAARRLFADSYLHGMRRNRQRSASIPLLLLRRRLNDLFAWKWQVEPLQTSVEFDTSPEFQLWRNRVSRLRALHEVNRHGLVVYNLIKYGSQGYHNALDTYGGTLLSRMGALSHGPLHIGRSVALEEFARFNRVFIVYYPSARYFADLLASQFFQGISGNRLQGDMIKIATVPITERL